MLQGLTLAHAIAICRGGRTYLLFISISGINPQPVGEARHGCSTRSFCQNISGTALALALGSAAAQSFEVFTGQDMWGTQGQAAAPAPQPQPQLEPETDGLSRCLADPDPVNCRQASDAITFETVRVNYGARGTPRVTPTPSDPDAPQPVSPGSLQMAEMDVRYQFNSTEVAVGEDAKVQQLAAALVRPPSSARVFLVLGHTDAIGSDAANCTLSRRRAAALVDKLVAAGVERHRLIPIGVGEAMPKEPNPGRSAVNRRVGLGPLPDDSGPVLRPLRALCA